MHSRHQWCPPGICWCRILVCVALLLISNAALAALVPAQQSVSPCQTGTKAAAVLLQAARQQLPLRQGAPVKSSDVVRVRSWQQLVDAVQQAKGPTASGAWKVFELKASTAITATSTLQLKPGMAVVAAGARQAGGSRVSISCQDGVQSAFGAVLAPGTTQGAGGVLLQGLSISGCKGSAVRVSGGLTTPQGVQWASLPPGLHLVNNVLTGNAAAVGGGVRASRAAVYLDSVELSGNKAEQLGGGVSIDGGLLVAMKTVFKGNSAGAGGLMTSTGPTGSGAAVFANSSTVVMADSKVTSNTGLNIGGCAIRAAKSRGVVIANSTFDSNTCEGSGAVVDYVASTCSGGGASLMVESDMPPFGLGNATDCAWAPKHLVHISDTTFQRDMASVASCGGSLMLASAWLELHRSSISGTGETAAKVAGAIASTGSAVVLQDSRIVDHRASDRAGALYQRRGRLWASNTTFANASVVRRDGGGCLYVIDVTEVKISGCAFENCMAPYGGGGLFCQVMYEQFDSPPPISIHASRFSRNRVWRDGGAMNILQMDLTVTDTVFEHNEGYYGGVLNTGSGPISMTRTRLINNTAMVGGQGGTIYAMDPKDANFTDCSWLNNSAYQGGGIYASRFGKKADWAFTRCKFEGNTADQRGAAVWTTGMNYTFTATNFSANKALMGAAVYATNSGTKRKLNMMFNKCVMEGNAAEQSAGVAWVTGYKNVSLDSCRIAGNRAGQSAGGLYLQDTPARIAGCVLSGNRARSAAAVMLQGNDSVVQAVGSLFQDNMATDQAGACLLMAGSSLALSRTAFSNNSASTAGGAVSVLDGAKLSCSSRCNFSTNSAALGGAIAVHSASVNLTDTALVRNTAPAALVTVVYAKNQMRAGSGGAVFAANASLSLSKSSLQDNSAEARGGALQLLSSTASLVGTKLTGNRAAAAAASTTAGANATGAAAASRLTTAGGAILAGLLPVAGNGSKQAQLLLQDCVLSGNTAGFGGAIAAVDVAADVQQAPAAATGVQPPAAPLSIVLVGSFLSNNAAGASGGAVFTSLPSASLTLNNSKVSSNTAAEGGGGIAAVTPAAVEVVGSSVSGNQAAFCAGMLLDTSARASAVRGSRFERNVAMQQLGDSNSFGQLPRWNSSGSGGGMCIIPGGPVAVTKSTITLNTALYGAGLFVQDCVSRKGAPISSEDMRIEQLQSSTSASSNDCRVSIGSQTVISGNRQQAGGSGSSLYTTDTAAVAMAPDARAGRVSNRSSSVITEAGPTDSLAAKPDAVLGGFQDLRSSKLQGGVLLVESGSKLPAVQLWLVDQLGQPLPPSLLQQLTFKAQAAATHSDSRSDTNLLGVTSVVPGGPVNSSGGAGQQVSFDWLELQGAPGETLNVSFAVLEAPEVRPAVVQVQLKECTAGQAVLRGRRPDLYAGCTNCTNPLFSFDPAAPQCSTCPPPGTYSVCSGDVLTPADGYWQSHPRSAQLLQCPNPAACSRSTAAAAQLAAQSATFAAAAPSTAAAGQSQRGLLQAAVQGGQQEAAAYQQLQCADGYSGNLCSNCDRSSRVTQTLSHSCKSCGVSRAGSVALFVLLRLFDLSVVLLSVFLVFKERQRHNMAVNGGLVTSDSIRAAMQQGTLVKALPGSKGPVEHKPLKDQHGTDEAGSIGVDAYLQLFIEFMQLLSIFRLTRISVVWRSAAEAVLLAMSIAPISSYGWVSFECLLREGLSPQQYALDSTLASTYIPVALVVVVCAIVLVHHIREARRLRYPLKDYPALAPEMLLAAVKAVAYGYPVVIGSVLGLFSCKQLNSPATVPGEVNAAVGNFWNRDLDTVCFQGTHLTYALAVGVPMLLLIALYPLVQLLLLSRQARRQPDGLADVSFWANYSMLYQDYKQHMYLWGSVRDLRQLLLVAVVVVLQPYPVQVQMVGGWVLSLALLLSHVSLLPFRTVLLNGLQTVMLAAVSFTFYASVLSSVTGFPAKGSTAFQYIAILLNLLVALLLLGVLIWRARLWLDFDKDGKVSWTDVKQTVQSGGETTTTVLKRMASTISSAASLRSTGSGGRSSSKIAEQHSGAAGSARASSLAAANSQALEGFDSQVLRGSTSLGTAGTSGPVSSTTAGLSGAMSSTTGGLSMPMSSITAGFSGPVSSTVLNSHSTGGSIPYEVTRPGSGVPIMPSVEAPAAAAAAAADVLPAAK